MFCIKCGGKTEFVSIAGDELKERSMQNLWVYSLLQSQNHSWNSTN